MKWCIWWPWRFKSNTSPIDVDRYSNTMLQYQKFLVLFITERTNPLSVRGTPVNEKANI